MNNWTSRFGMKSEVARLECVAMHNGPIAAGQSHGTKTPAGEQGTHWDKTNKENYHFR